MRVTRVRLQNYRNIAFVDLPLNGDTHFFVGSNAQGKSNLLEGIGMIAALRSFRTHDTATLIRKGGSEARLVVDVADEEFGPTEISITLKKKGKEVQVDGRKVNRFRDYIGRFPAVILNSQDIQLLRGTPGIRRQWLDLVLASASHVYFDGLRDYHRVLNERNSLLKQRGSIEEMHAFESILAEKAALLIGERKTRIPHIEKHFQQLYATISGGGEAPELKYLPDSAVDSKDHFLSLLDKSREKDSLFKSTQHGPHRDDIEFRLEERKAREYASEGQQRSLIIALKIAQLRYLEETGGRTPVLLADDVLGELDRHRKATFWSAVGNKVQVIATGTEIPSGTARPDCQLFEVSAGTFIEKPLG